MSNYSNGQPYYTQTNYSGQYHNNQYTIGNSGQQVVRRRSYDAGDDPSTFDQGQNQNQSQYHGYGSPQPQAQSYGGSAGTMQQSLPYRTASQSQLGGYQHQSQPTPPVHASYNPAQYHTQSTHNPQAYGSPQPNTYSIGGQQPGYQPYVPAAYQDSTLMRNASVYNNHYAASQNAYNQGPVPPPRPYTSQSPGQSYTSDLSQNYAGTYSGQYLPIPSPPAPPPPPHHESLTAARPYSHATSNHDQYDDLYVHQDANASLSTHSGVIRNTSSASRDSTISHQYSASPQPIGTDPPSRVPSRDYGQAGNMFERHPQGRTLPGLPSESESDAEHYRRSSNNTAGYDDLMHTLDAAIGTSRDQNAYSPGRDRDPLFSSASPYPDDRQNNNGIISTGDHNINYGAFANDSDAEAAAGVAAMQAADEQEAVEEARRRSSQGQPPSSGRYASDRERSDDSDYAGYGDLSLAGGGYAATMHYGDDVVSAPASGYNHQLNQRMNSMRSSGVSSEGQASQTSYDMAYGSERFQSVPTLHTEMARVDASGTGGFTEPSAHPRRLSYDDGDEAGLSEYGDGHSDIPDLFFHPGMNPNRPLPPPPAPVRSGSDSGSRSSAHLSTNQNRYSAYDTLPRSYPNAPDAYNNDALSPSMVPRSTSLAGARSQPRAEQPMRSKTDADRARYAKQQAGRTIHEHGYESTTPKTDMGTIDLPAIPRKKLDPAKISISTLDKCTEPWAMSSVLSWIRSLTDEETDLKENTITEVISKLFSHKVPTISFMEADSLASQFVTDMFSSHVLQRDEEWVKFTPGTISGVLFQLTGLGCYSSRVHSHPDTSKGRCYSQLCMRTVKKADFYLPATLQTIPWHEFHKLTNEQALSRGKKEVERQNILRELVYGEDGYLMGLDIIRTLYRDRLAKSGDSIMPAKKVTQFCNDVFGLAEKCRIVNESHLAPQLHYRENEQGPWVVGYSDIFREWIRKAKKPYIDFAKHYPKVDMMIREETKRNPAFANFLDQARKEPISNKHGWDNWLKSPIQRMQRYILLLDNVHKGTVGHPEEKLNLGSAIDELRAVTHEMDVQVNEVNKTLELSLLQKKIKLRKYSGDPVNLNLEQMGRTTILRSDLMRQGGMGVSWVPCHAMLFDNYLVLAKPVRDSHGNEFYDVSKPPIPMVLISLESAAEPAVMKSSVRGVTQVAGAAGRVAAVNDPRLNRTTSSQSGGTLVHTSTGLTGGSGNSGSSMVASAVVDQGDSKDDRIYYPFRVKHLGRPEVYTLFALSADKRQEWAEAILSAKTTHAEALHFQNAEPFSLRVLADTAFGSDSYSYGQKRSIIRGTPLDRAVGEVEKRYSGSGRPAPVCRTAVNCATVFQQPAGRFMCAIGTDSGVYISEYNNPRGWVRSIQMTRVTQIAVLEEFNLMILLSDKILIAYHLDVVCPPSGPPVPQADSSVRKAPQKLSGSKDVGFFLAGKMKDRVLVFYQKKDGINSIFKILEPVLQKSATSRSRWLGNSSRRGQTEFFREYDEFYIPAETYGLNMFHSSLAVATKRGMEVLTLDKKITWGVPNLESDIKETKKQLEDISIRIKDLRPLGMFRLSEAEFLVAFSECAVYVNKLGDISRSVIMDFVGRANNACLYYPYLVLFNDDFVEIRDAQNGRMKQVIAGRDIRLLDDGGNVQPGQQAGASLGGGLNGLGVQNFHTAPKTVKLSMQHPEYDKSYIVVEMLLRTEQKS